jgi:YD repeat-containing protein
VDFVEYGTLRFARYYNSNPGTVGSAFGTAWRSTYLQTPALGFPSAVWLYRPDGKSVRFLVSSNNFVPDADITDRLYGETDTVGTVVGYRLETAGNQIEHYDTAGRLTSITDANGQTQTLAYDMQNRLATVTDSFGRQLTFGYDTQNRVATLTDPAGKQIGYTYDAANNLSAVTYQDGKVKTYHYNEAAYTSGANLPNVLTGITDENNVRFVTYTYDSSSRAIGEQLIGGVEAYQLNYGTNSTTVTDPRGTVRTYNFTTVLGVVKSTGANQPIGSGCGAASNAQTYDANGNVATRTDFNGNLTTYTYDLTRNLETQRVEASGKAEARTISTKWHPDWRLALKSAEPLRLTTLVYNGQPDPGNGNALASCAPTTALVNGKPIASLCKKIVQATTDTNGSSGFAATVTGAPRTTTYTYNSLGQVLTVNGPRTDVTDVTSYTYNPVTGNLLTVSNAFNQLTTLGNYDANGRAGTLTDPNGLVTGFTYDVRGRLTDRDLGNTGTEKTHYTYDGVGQLKTVTVPSGAIYTYTYDPAHRLTDIADNLGNHIHYTLDVMGNRTQEQTFDSSNTLARTHSRSFDALNRLYQDIGAINQTTTYAYDANGNLTSITDPLSRQTVNSYDALNRLSQTTDAASGLTRYGYDGLDQLINVTDPRTLITQYTRDGLGNLNQQTSPDTGSTGLTHDAVGNVLTRTDAKGQLANYAYDALNRLTGIAYSVGGVTQQTVAYLYDQGTNGIGHLTQIVDSTGTTNYSYDKHGRQTGEARQDIAGGTTYTTAYSYDTQGRMNNITYPSGRAIGYTFDSMGRINQISTTFNSTTRILASNISYEPFGGVHSFTYGDGTTAPVQTYVRQRDQDGRIASYTLNGKAMSIGYDTASQISFISDPTNINNLANYSYDTLSRLTSYTQSAINQGYGYDADGNRTTQTLGSTTSTYGYAPGSNKLASIQTGATTQNIAQDANGATTSDATRQYNYDLRGRLIQVTTAQGVINYEVNALGLRVRKQVPYTNTDTLYHYDAQGHLIGESPAGSTQFTREYIYLGDQPVAVMQ